MMTDTAYRIRPTRWLVAPDADLRIFAEYGYSVEIDDEGGGEYVRVRSHSEETAGEHSISIDTKPWRVLRAAIDAAFDEVAKYADTEPVQLGPEAFQPKSAEPDQTVHFASGSEDALPIGEDESRHSVDTDDRRIEEQMRWQVKAWQSTGEKGRSSEAMAAAFLSKSTFDCYANDYPRDPDDFRRCMQLLDAAPLARGYMHRVADMGIVWAKLVDRWPEIEAEFRRELKGGTGLAPSTFGMMRALYE